MLLKNLNAIFLLHLYGCADRRSGSIITSIKFFLEAKAVQQHGSTKVHIRMNAFRVRFYSFLNTLESVLYREALKETESNDG